MMTTPKNITSKATAKKVEVEEIEDPSFVLSGEIIYADKISTFSFGNGVSRLGLSVEVGPGKSQHISTIVLPTHHLIEALDFMLSTLRNNPQMKEALVQGSNALLALLDNQEPKKS